jgi:hypothetical protein
MSLRLQLGRCRSLRIPGRGRTPGFGTGPATLKRSHSTGGRLLMAAYRCAQPQASEAAPMDRSLAFGAA